MTGSMNTEEFNLPNIPYESEPICSITDRNSTKHSAESFHVSKTPDIGMNQTKNASSHLKQSSAKTSKSPKEDTNMKNTQPITSSTTSGVFLRKKLISPFDLIDQCSADPSAERAIGVPGFGLNKTENAKFTVTPVSDAKLNQTENANQPDNEKQVATVSYFHDVERKSATRTGRKKKPISPFDVKGPDPDPESQTQGLTLFEEDLMEGNLATAVNKTVHYDDVEKNKGKANLGTFFGVFLPCCQNIVGVIYFVRFPWIVGCAGILEGCAIVGICNLISITTAISMSAIATNGRVTAGGTYFMISRSLGPSFGGSVGLLFFLGTSFSVAMYYIGTMEVLMKNVAPQLQLFHDTEDNPDAHFHNYRIYGTCLLLIMATVVFIGVKCVSRFALFAIIFLVGAILSVMAGLIKSAVGYANTIEVCALGDRLVKYDIANYNGTWYCNKDKGGPVYKAYCSKTACDEYFENHDLRMISGFPGFSLRLLQDTLYHSYTLKGDIPGSDIKSTDPIRDIVTDISTSFVFLFSIYFPSITGVESGSNYSGDLKDAQKSIPRGTLTAVAVTSTLYLSSVVLMGASVEGVLLRDKFGESLSNSGDLMLSMMAWPSKWCVLCGALTATIGAGMQALAGGPRLLQAIASDEILPALSFFAKKTRGEPVRGLMVTFIIALSGILGAYLDYVAPIVTMFFLMCYGFINFAVTLQSLVDSPHWRPRFKCYHWFITLLGSALCLVSMFLCEWRYALGAIITAFALYKYIEYKGAEKEWGDGMTGLNMTAAIYALNKLSKAYTHTKNWRPQIIVLLKMNKPTNPEEKQWGVASADYKLIMLSNMLKEGKGLTLYGTIIKGYLEDMAEAQGELVSQMYELLNKHGAKGFVEAVVNPSISEGLSCLCQSAGLGALRPNTVIIGWPHDWMNKRSASSYQIFIDTMQTVSSMKKAVIIMKADSFPNSNERVAGTIDVWWVVNDGGMLLLIALLLQRGKTWSKCKLRLFSVAHEMDNTIQIKKDLQIYLYQLRINGTVEVVEMTAEDMSTYVYERTMKMEELTRMMGTTRAKSRVSIQGIMTRKGQFDKNPQIILENARSNTDARSRVSDTKDVLQPSDQNLRHMNTSIKLNKLMKEKSKNASLVIINLPSVPETMKGQHHYMHFLETLCEGIDPVLLIRASGQEVITVYN